MIFHSFDPETLEFDSIMGCIEQIIVSDEFERKQSQFLETYYRHFDDADENKLEYMDIFREYLETIEGFIQDHVQNAHPHLKMADFLREIENMDGVNERMEGDVFDMLYTFGDFLAFKEMVLNYKMAKEGKFNSLSSVIEVKSLKIN